MKSNQIRKSKAIYPEFPIVKESATTTCTLSEKRKSFQVEKKPQVCSEGRLWLWGCWRWAN